MMPRASPVCSTRPTRSIRGQLTLLPAGSVPSLALPVIGEGYAVPLPDGVTLTGATYESTTPTRRCEPPGTSENLRTRRADAARVRQHRRPAARGGARRDASRFAA